MADVLNAQFQSVFTTESPESCPYVKRFASYLTSSSPNQMLINCWALKNGKASEVNNLSTRQLKECADNISLVLTFIFNQTLADGKLPDNWKSANITPIFRKGPNDLAKNYRSVSLTSVISKTMEHIIYSHNTDHLERNNIITPCQHGFRYKLLLRDTFCDHNWWLGKNDR